MATQFTNEQGRQLVGCLVFCLRADGPRRLLEWFNFTGPEKEALLKILRSLLGEGMEMDLPSLRKMVQTFMDLTNPATVADRNRKSWEAVANAKSKVQGLEPNVTGRRIWYESLMEEGDTEWKEDAKPPPEDEQFYLSKLRKVGNLTLEYLKTLEDRWKKGEKMLQLYKSFMKIANTTGPGQTILNLQLKDTTVGKVVATIKQGNREANEWAKEISAYFNVAVAGKFQDAMKFFFSGSGCEPGNTIDWGKLKKRLEDGDITALKMVSEEIKPANEMTEVSTTLNILGETMLRVNSLGEEPVETEKERKDNQRRQDVREGFKKKYERWYHIIVAAYIADGKVEKLKASKTQLIKYGEIVKSLAGTWADIRNFDSDFAEVRKLKYHVGELEKDIEVEDGLIEMSERIREAEEELKEERKAKEDLQKQDVKRSEAMMKKENMVTYEGKASFLEWAGTITKLLEQLPESTADVIVCSFVKTTINHKETFNLIQNCKTTEEIMKIMGELHATDKSVVIEAFAPVKQLKKPTTYSIAFHNGQVILRTADTLISIGIEEAIELNELDLCVDKAIHDARYQAWLEYSHTELKKLAAEDAKGHPVEKTKLEEKGKYDITHSIQSFNKGRSLARNFHLLCKWIKEDMSLVQDAKDREERTHNRGHSGQRGGGNTTGNYFVQQNPGNPNAFMGNRGGRQASGGYRRPYGTNGGAPQGQRFPGGSQGRPNKHPDCQIALDRWRTLKGVGAEVKPMTKDCPLKCSHAIPFGNAGWCATFRKYEPSMKLDVVKKNGLCRRCLSNWGPPHSPKDCRAPACSKCKGDHNALICPSPSGSVQVHATGFVDIYRDRDVFDDLDPQIMMLTVDDDEQGMLGGNEDEFGQYYVGEAAIEEYTEDDIIFEDPDEPVNHFCINFIEDTLHCNTTGRCSQSQETSRDNGDREATMPEVGRISSKEAMGELKSDDTKPTGQKGGGGHLMTEGVDSLRTNASSESNIKPGYKNTEGTTICKVNTIHQADQNSEPLCAEKPVQETGAKDLTGGKSERENYVEWEANYTEEERDVASQERQQEIWSGVEKTERNEGVIRETLSEDKNTKTIGCTKGDKSAPHQVTRDNTRSTSGIGTDYDIIEQKYRCYRENADYHPLNKRTAKDSLEKELYTRMVKAAVRINRIFPSVRGITDTVCVMGIKEESTQDVSKKEERTWVNCLFDSGAEIGTHAKTLETAVELEKIEEKPMILNTVNGAVKKIYDIKKVKLIAGENQQQRREIHTMSSAQVEHIGIEKGHMEAYVNMIAFLLQMTPKLREHFIKQCKDDKKEIQLILGQKGGSMLMDKVIPEQLGLRQHWLLPNITIFRSSLTQNLLIAGELGIDGKLVDEDYPTLYPTKRQFEELKRKLGNGEDITDDLGEHLMAKHFAPSECSGAEHNRQQTESSARSSGVRINDEGYARNSDNDQQAEQRLGGEVGASSILKGIDKGKGENQGRFPTHIGQMESNKLVTAKQDRKNIAHQTEEESVEELAGAKTDTRSTGECNKCKQENCQDCEIRASTYKMQNTDLHIQGLNACKKETMYTGEEALNKDRTLAQDAKFGRNIKTLREEIARKLEQGTLWGPYKTRGRGAPKRMDHCNYITEDERVKARFTRAAPLQGRMLKDTRENYSPLETERIVLSSNENLMNKYISQVLGYAPQAEHCYRDVMRKEQALILMQYEWDRYTKTTSMRAMHVNTGIKFGDAMSTLTLRSTQHDIIMKAKGFGLEWTPSDDDISEDIDSSYIEHGEEPFNAMETIQHSNDPEDILPKGRGNNKEGTLDLAKETRESPTNTLRDIKERSGNTVVHEEHTTVTDFAEPLFPWELTRRVISNMVTEAWSRLDSIWVPVATNLKKWVTKGLQAIRAQSTEEKGGEVRSDPKSMTDKLQNHNKGEKNQKAGILSEETNNDKGKANWSPTIKDLKKTDEMTPVHPTIAKLLGATNPLNKRATDEMRQKQKRILVHPGVTTQPKGPLMIKGEGCASSDGTDTNGGKWTPCPERIARTKEKPGSIIENSKRAKTQASDRIEERIRMRTIHKMETIQEAKDRKRLAVKLEIQDSNTGIPRKIRREHVEKESEAQTNNKEDQGEEAERRHEKESKGDEIHDTWEIVPSEELRPKNEQVMTTEEKETDEQAGKPEGVIMTPSELETRKKGRQVMTENPMTDGIREEPNEYSEITDCVKEKTKKEASLGEFDEWTLIETPSYTAREVHEDRLETHNKESGTVQMKPRDMNMDKPTY